VTYRDGARQLSYLIDHNGKKIANGVTLTQNDKGTKFCIIPIGTSDFTAFTHVNPKRRTQLLAAFEEIAGEELPVTAENERTAVLFQKLSFGRVITLCNLASDPITPKLRYRPVGELLVLHEDGKTVPLSYREENGFFIADTVVPAFGVCVLLDRTRNT
ncbi:MAG: hypothetical protein MJ078_08265, partial [Clostridia bacterium]|nr:hypothetical protein [Clostridia bacterium]